MLLTIAAKSRANSSASASRAFASIWVTLAPVWALFRSSAAAAQGIGADASWLGRNVRQCVARDIVVGRAAPVPDRPFSRIPRAAPVGAAPMKGLLTVVRRRLDLELVRRGLADSRE